jgi:SMP-30/Gluconolactonase/LRE-like region/NHL repeat
MKNNVIKSLVLILSTLSAGLAANTYHDATQVTLSGIQTAWGVAHDGSSLYVSDWDADVIHKFDVNGTEIATIGHTGSDPGEFYGPKGLAVDENGRIYVCDAGNERVQVLNPDGSFLAAWGDPTAGATTSFSPEGIALGSDGHVYVSDGDNHRVVIYDRQGNFIGTWGHLEFVGTDGFAWPEGLAVDAANNVYVTDSGNGRVLCYTSTGTFIRQYGQRGLGQGNFDSPTGVAVTPDGRVFVADNGAQMVQVFDAAGNFQYWWGQNQNGAYFQDLFGMDLGLDGRVLVADGMSGHVYSLTWDNLDPTTSWVGAADSARLQPKATPIAATEFAVGPVPAAPGESLCLSLQSSPTSGEWRVYTLDGRLVVDLHFDGMNPQCWNGTGGLPKGMYFVELHEAWGDGHHQERVQKIILR